METFTSVSVRALGGGSFWLLDQVTPVDHQKRRFYRRSVFGFN